MKKISFFFVFLFFSFKLYSDESQFWSSLQLSHDFNDKNYFYSELIYRKATNSSDFSLSSTRIGLGRDIGLNLKAFYIVENTTHSNSNNDEFRHIFQLGRSIDLKHIQLSTRARWELRKYSDSQRWANRIRGQLRGDLTAVTFININPFLAHEYLRTLNTVEGRSAGLQDLRSQIGLSYKFKSARLDMAYLNRYQINIDEPDTQIHVANLTLAFKF